MNGSRLATGSKRKSVHTLLDAGVLQQSPQTTNRSTKGRLAAKNRASVQQSPRKGSCPMKGKRIVRAGDFLVDLDCDESTLNSATNIITVREGISDKRTCPTTVGSNTTTSNVLTEDYILSFGLQKVNFEEKRQQRVNQKKNVERFKAHYGPTPKAVLNIFKDLKEVLPSAKLIYLLLTLNWFKLYDTEKVLSGRWDFCEDHIRCKIKYYGAKIQSLKEKKIVFGNFHEDEVHWITVDCVNFPTEEFRLDPSSKYYNPKNNGCGLKYEFAVALRRPDLVHMKGPIPCGEKHDSTIFRGGTKNDKKDQLDKSSLYFKLPMGKKGIADSGYEGMPEKLTLTRSGQSKDLKQFLGRAKNRQETLHSRLKSYRILGSKFRHGKKGTQDKLDLHQMCVEAICVIVQYDMEAGRPIFDM